MGDILTDVQPPWDNESSTNHVDLDLTSVQPVSAERMRPEPQYPRAQLTSLPTREPNRPSSPEPQPTIPQSPVQQEPPEPIRPEPPQQQANQQQQIPHTQTQSAPTRQSHKKLIIISASVLFTLVILGAGAYFVIGKNSSEQSSESTQTDTTTSSNASGTTSTIYEKASKHIILPENETPTIVPVTNKDELGNEEQFKNVQNGDMFLVFTESKLAVVYRESEDKIVTVSALDLNSQPQATQ